MCSRSERPRSGPPLAGASGARGEGGGANETRNEGRVTCDEELATSRERSEPRSGAEGVGTPIEEKGFFPGMHVTGHEERGDLHGFRGRKVSYSILC